MSRIALAIVMLLAASPAFADACRDAADDVMREAKEASLPPEAEAQVKILLEQALGRRETGDDMGCLSGVEEARALVRQQQ